MKSLFKVVSLSMILISLVFAQSNSSYSLKNGWNLVGTGLQDNEVILDNLILGDSISLLWTYDTIEGWKAYSQKPEIRALIGSSRQANSILPGRGIWVLSQSDVNLSLSGENLYIDTFIGSVKTNESGVIVPVADANITISNDIQSFSTLTDENGTYMFNQIPYGNYLLTVTANGFNEVNGSALLDSPTETYSQIILQIVNDITLAYSYTFNGKIVDAISGEGVENVTLKIYQGLNNQTGTILYEMQTGLGGAYSFANIPAGNYTVVSQKDGYIKTVNSIQLFTNVDGSTITQDYTIAPYSQNIRIVLTWGATPSDLDSHFAKMNDTTREWHVYYSNKEPFGAESNLDIDDTDSYGPETTTLISIDNNATYKYYVHDYSNQYSSDSSALSNSNAKVTIYIEENKYVFNVPNYGGTIWKVFEIVNGNIIPCVGSQCMNYESNDASENFGLMRTIPNYDINFKDLPLK